MQGLFSSLILENIIAVPERIFESTDLLSQTIPTRTINRNAESAEELNTIVEQTMSEITDKIINPILNTHIKDMENKFSSLVFPFELKLRTLNRIIFKGMGKEDLGKIIITLYISYEEIKKDVNVNKEINDEYKSQIISIIDRIRDYDIALFGIAKNNVQQIIEALHHIDIDVLRTYIYSGILAFFCILQFLRLGRNDENKLQALLVLADKNLQTMEAWVNSIDVLSRQGGRIDSPPKLIEGNVGSVKSDGFEINLIKMEIGKDYFIKYDTSEYKVRKSEKGELVLYELG